MPRSWYARPARTCTSVECSCSRARRRRGRTSRSTSPRGCSLVPRYRQKLAHPRFEMGRPMWIDDPSFNLGYHVRHSALPSPGSEHELRQLVGRIFSQRLDRSKPLWEIWLVEGLEQNRFAVISKVHHALVDGVSGVDLTTVMFDTGPEGTPGPARGRAWRPHKRAFGPRADRRRGQGPRQAALRAGAQGRVHGHAAGRDPRVGARGSRGHGRGRLVDGQPGARRRRSTATSARTGACCGWRRRWPT